MDIWAYLTLFSSGLLAATMLPAQSEALLVAMLVMGKAPAWALLTAVSVGNVLGSVLNWVLGRGIERFRDRRWFPLKGTALDKAKAGYQRYGKWSLLLSWMPLIGDPLTIVAGVMREPFLPFLVLVTIGKVGRYFVLYALTLGLWPT